MKSGQRIPSADRRFMITIAVFRNRNGASMLAYVNYIDAMPKWKISLKILKVREIRTDFFSSVRRQSKGHQRAIRGPTAGQSRVKTRSVPGPFWASFAPSAPHQHSQLI